MTEMFEMLSTSSWISEARRHRNKHQPSSNGAIRLRCTRGDFRQASFS